MLRWSTSVLVLVQPMGMLVRSAKSAKSAKSKHGYMARQALGPWSESIILPTTPYRQYSFSIPCRGLALSAEVASNSYRLAWAFACWLCGKAKRYYCGLFTIQPASISSKGQILKLEGLVRPSVMVVTTITVSQLAATF